MIKCILNLLLNMLCNNLASEYIPDLAGERAGLFLRIRTDYCSEPLGVQTMQENYKILVVDDDMRLRALLERYLTEQGFRGS